MPTEMLVAFIWLGRDTRAGLVVFPPVAFSPQQYTLPSSVSAHVWSTPVRACTT